MHGTKTATNGTLSDVILSNLLDRSGVATCVTRCLQYECLFMQCFNNTTLNVHRVAIPLTLPAQKAGSPLIQPIANLEQRWAIVLLAIIGTCYVFTM